MAKMFVSMRATRALVVGVTVVSALFAAGFFDGPG
jgi:hypothetical protein